MAGWGAPEAAAISSLTGNALRDDPLTGGHESPYGK